MTAAVLEHPAHLADAWTVAQTVSADQAAVQDRRAAWERFAERGLPRRKEESWRYLNFSALRDTEFALDPGARWVVNPTAAGEGVRPLFLGQDFDTAASVSRSVPGRSVDLADPADPFTALNEALSGEALDLEVPAGTRATFVHVVHDSSGADPMQRHPRLRVRVGEGASLHLVEEYVGEGAGSWTNVLTEFDLAAGAGVRHVRLQRESVNSLHTASVLVDQGRDARYHGMSVVVGGGLTRIDVRTRLREPGAESDLLGLYAVRGRQVVDHHTSIDHAAPNTASRQMYKGILSETARAVFNGHIRIREGSQQVTAEQSNHNLLLSRTALVNTNPQLEIHADDVKCRHGATVGQLDPARIFYLRSRGIAEDRARQLLTRAFLLEVAHAVEPAGLAAALESELEGMFFAHE